MYSNNTRVLSNEAPIILIWLPRFYGASLPDGKNSSFDYLSIIKNHKLNNKEERDIYLVINGSGFKTRQINFLRDELEEMQGVYLVDLLQYDWREIDFGWKIDGKDISIKHFFKYMYSIKDEQRGYFSIEIDTFKLIALSLLRQFTGYESGIYIDFDSLSTVKAHIGKDITIPEGGMLLGTVALIERVRSQYFRYTNLTSVSDDEYKNKYKFCLDFYLDNDCIVIDDLRILADIFSRYKGEILSQERIVDTLKLILRTRLPEVLDNCNHRMGNTDFSRCHFKIVQYISALEAEGISRLYDMDLFYLVGRSTNFLHLVQRAMFIDIENKILESDNPISISKSFLLASNNGNYYPFQNMAKSHLTWTMGNKLYHQRDPSRRLEDIEVFDLSTTKEHHYQSL